MRGGRCSSLGRRAGRGRRRWRGGAVEVPVREEVEEGYGKRGWFTNLAFLRQVSTSGGREVEIWGWVAVAEASQLRGGCWTSAIIIESMVW